MRKFEDILESNIKKHTYKLGGKALNRSFDGINRGDYVAVTGVSSSGKRSFVDHFYVISLLKQWYDMDEEARAMKPIKILYLSTKYPKEQKIMKWVANRYTTSQNRIMDIPTMTKSSGKLFKIDSSRVDRLKKESKIFEEAISEGVLEIEDEHISVHSIEKRIASLLRKYGSFNFEGESMEFTFNEEYENMLFLIVVDDVNHVAGGASTYGAGKMEKDEINFTLDKLFVDYTALGLSVVVVKKTSYPSYGKYMPSVKETNGLSVNKSIVMFNPAQEHLSSWGTFEVLDYTDDYDVQRLRFAFISYNSNGISNVYLPLLFMPENGIFAELSSKDTSKATKFNEELFDRFVFIRNNK